MHSMFVNALAVRVSNTLLNRTFFPKPIPLLPMTWKKIRTETEMEGNDTARLPARACTY